MDKVSVIHPENLCKNFIPGKYLPKGKDEYYLRNRQIKPPSGGWRNLTSEEVEILVKNDNTAENWEELLVSDPFDPHLIKRSRFYGLVRIGPLRNAILQHHDLRLPAGINNSLVISCDIGADVAIHNVHYLSHYIIGDCCILFNIQEMNTTDHAKFGNGIIKDGEPENVRTWIDIMNETGSRGVLPFDGMIPADAYIWAKYIDDSRLREKLKKITQSSIDNRRGYYGTVDTNCVIKNSLIIKDVKIGSYCYIKGANKLKNLTINSSGEEPSQIGEGVELVNGIIGYGCRIFYGCKAVKFVLGDNSNLKYGARLINSILGDNSTISCCEVLNNLIFPAHEQHHNNSFLVASLVMGQSNIAAGATIGSNHNSRANDNELVAGRGFWPGLCTSLKHPCRFSSFVLLSKADYPSELDIPLPFSLVNNNISENRLEVMPAYWWMYNMYALARNSWKFGNRDTRARKIQNIEFDTLAPDTAEEILTARRLLEIWTGKASLIKKGLKISGKTDDVLAEAGRKILEGKEVDADRLEVYGENMENSKRKTIILKPWKAYHAYNNMLHYYSVKNIIGYMQANPGRSLSEIFGKLKNRRYTKWINLGGQIVKESDADKIRMDICSEKLKTWKDIHKRYDDLWDRYSLEKQKHAYAVFRELYGRDLLTGPDLAAAVDKTVLIQNYICDQVYKSRRKDIDNPFRKITHRNDEEMQAGSGSLDQNSFIVQVRKETADFVRVAEKMKKRK